AVQKLSDVSRELSLGLERLSSGLRINRAADDAAGLAIASNLNADSRVYTAALRNVNDGVSALAITEGALKQQEHVVERLRELQTQAANGIYSFRQRAALDSEAQALRAEFNRILATTEFNGQKLLDGSAARLAVQTGYGREELLDISLGTFSQMVAGTGTYQ